MVCASQSSADVSKRAWSVHHSMAPRTSRADGGVVVGRIVKRSLTRMIRSVSGRPLRPFRTARRAEALGTPGTRQRKFAVHGVRGPLTRMSKVSPSFSDSTSSDSSASGRQGADQATWTAVSGTNSAPVSGGENPPRASPTATAPQARNARVPAHTFPTESSPLSTTGILWEGARGDYPGGGVEGPDGGRGPSRRVPSGLSGPGPQMYASPTFPWPRTSTVSAPARTACVR